MAEIFIRDYVDDFWGELFYIGMGENHSSKIVPKIEDAVKAGEKEITVNINSGGGGVYCSLSITNALKKAKEAGVKIITVNEGICASAATQIFMEGDERISYTSLFMIHNPSIFVFGNMEEADLKREADALKVVKDTILLTYKATGLDDETLTQMLNAETWLTPALCLSLGFSTEDRSSSEKKAEVLETSIKMVESASPENRIYATKFFNKIKINKNTNMENVKDTLEKNNTLLTEVSNFFKNFGKPKNEVTEVVNASAELEDGKMVYFEGDLAIGTAIFMDEALTEPAPEGDHTLMDGRTITVTDGKVSAIADVVEDTANNLAVENAALKAELATLKAEVTNLSKAVNASNEALAKIKNIKSTYEPAAREQEITRTNANAKDAKPDLSTEARAARKEELKNINKK